MTDKQVDRWRAVAMASNDGNLRGIALGMADRIEALTTERDDLHDRCKMYTARIEELVGESDALAAEVERLRGAMEGAAYLLIEATEQLRHGKIKTRRNRADNIDAFLASLKGEET